MKPFALVLVALTATAFVRHVWAAPAAATDVVVDAAMAYPESLSSTPDGTLYIGSINRGEVYRALKGEKRATTWISKQAGNFGIVLGVLADARSNRLYICDNHGDSAYLKTFSLKTAGLIK